MRVWDEERIDLLVAGYRNDYTDKELALLLDVTDLAVKSKAASMGLTRKRKYDEERLEIIRSGYLNDVPVSEIAAFLGFSTRAVYQGALLIGVQRTRAATKAALVKRPRPKSFWDDKKDACLRNHYPWGTPVRTIVEMLGEGCNRNMVIGRAHRLNLVHGQHGKSRFKLRLAA